MKSVWQEMNRRMEQQQRLSWQVLHEAKLAKARHSLWPLFFGQLVQMIIGVLVIVLAVAYWSSHRDVPHRLVAGIIVHVYGVLLIMLGGITLAKMRAIDYSEPVTTIQKHLGHLRRFYILNGMIVGLPWWVLWVAFMQVVFGLLGADLYRNSPETVWGSIIVGIAGLTGTYIFHKWSRQPHRSDLAKALDDSATGGSLVRAGRFIEQVAEFEKESN